MVVLKIQAALMLTAKCNMIFPHSQNHHPRRCFMHPLDQHGTYTYARRIKFPTFTTKHICPLYSRRFSCFNLFFVEKAKHVSSFFFSFHVSRQNSPSLALSTSFALSLIVDPAGINEFDLFFTKTCVNIFSHFLRHRSPGALQVRKSSINK